MVLGWGSQHLNRTLPAVEGGLPGTDSPRISVVGVFFGVAVGSMGCWLLCLVWTSLLMLRSGDGVGVRISASQQGPPVVVGRTVGRALGSLLWGFSVLVLVAGLVFSVQCCCLAVAVHA